jgi:hypothetical protein
MVFCLMPFLVVQPVAAVSTSCDVFTAKLNELRMAKSLGPHSARVADLQEYLNVRTAAHCHLNFALLMLGYALLLLLFCAQQTH